VGYDFGDRPRPPYVGDERETLDGWLNFHRATLLWKCEGLRLEQLKVAPIPSSSLTLLGLVRHLTEDERGWFLGFLGRPVPDLYETDDHPGGDFDVDGADAAADLARFGQEVDAIAELLQGRSLDEVEVIDGRSYSLRWVITHMIEEYARHNGHADLLREAIDGSTGD
jgi:hypothetical protein